MFDNGSLLRRRKRFKTAAKQRMAAGVANTADNFVESNDQADLCDDYSDYESGDNDEEEEEAECSREDQISANTEQAKNSFLLTQQQMNPIELNEMYLISSNFKSNRLTQITEESPLSVNIPKSMHDTNVSPCLSHLSSTTSNSSIASDRSSSSPLSKEKPTLNPQHSSSPIESKPKNSSSFSIDCLIGASTQDKVNKEKTCLNTLNPSSQTIKKQSQPFKSLLSKKKTNKKQLFIEQSGASNPLISRHQPKSNSSRGTSISSTSRIESRSSDSSSSRCGSPDVGAEPPLKHFKSNTYNMNMFNPSTFLPFNKLPMGPGVVPQTDATAAAAAAFRLRNSLSLLYSPSGQIGLPLDCSQSSTSSSSSSSSSFSTSTYMHDLHPDQQQQQQFSSPVLFNKNSSQSQQHIYKMFNDAMLMRVAMNAAAASSQFNSNMHNFILYNNGLGGLSSNATTAHLNVPQQTQHNSNSDSNGVSLSNKKANISNVLPFFLPIQQT